MANPMDQTGFGMPTAHDFLFTSPLPNNPLNNDQNDSDKTTKRRSPGAHKRTYQACLPCRNRKVKCDLGEVDNPHDPPCGRCRREAKECYFSATRRKKRSAADSEAGDEHAQPAHKRLQTTSSTPAASHEYAVYDDDEEQKVPRTPRGAFQYRSQPLRRPTASSPLQIKQEDVFASDSTIAALQTTDITSGHEALKFLHYAGDPLRNRTLSVTSLERPNFGLGGVNPYFSRPFTTAGTTRITQRKGNLDMEAAEDTLRMVLADPVEFSAGHAAWSRFRFVRGGWFSAKEGMDYILYFYKYLAPLTPIVLPDFRKLSSHKHMLEEEPMLAVTLVLIASRHMILLGPSCDGRPAAIHDRLYDYLSGMVHRLVWGQELWGLAFTAGDGPGIGADENSLPASDINPLSRKGLRTLGTVESLLLLTEWHPRATHFPPDENDDELMASETGMFQPDFSRMSAKHISQTLRGPRMNAWLEPYWRSDRMCWMLTGMAMSLAFEIGVFDKARWERHAIGPDGQPLPAELLAAYDQRRGNVRDVLLIYMTLTSGRVGLTSMLPTDYSKPEDSDLYPEEALIQQPGVHQVTLHFWIRIAAIMREGNREIYANKESTRELINTGRYKTVLDNLRPRFEDWQRRFNECTVMPQYMRCILEIEFEYARVHFNSVALQAVVMRCANDLNAAPTNAPAASAADPSGTGAGPITPSVLAKVLSGDRKYVMAIGDAARKLLKIVVEGLAPEHYLRHAPVRTYFRIISSSMMLMKSFSLGASESDAADSLHLMERTVQALRNCVVDDVHVACRFADLLDGLARDLKVRLVRVAADGRAGRSRRASRQETRPHTPNNRPANQQQASRQPAQTAASAASNTTLPHAEPNANGSNLNMQGTGTLSNAQINSMFGISNEVYDLTGPNNDFMVMPPPGFAVTPPSTLLNGPMVSGADGGYGYPNYATANDLPPVQQQDWFLLPLNRVLDMPSADVDQNMLGPTLNGVDMLDFLLEQPAQYGSFEEGFYGPGSYQ